MLWVMGSVYEIEMDKAEIKDERMLEQLKGVVGSWPG
jgi:hypothetical protein